MSKTPSHQKIKKSVRELYARMANIGSVNISDAPIDSGENLARTLGYDTSKLSIPKEAWELFAGCGNPLEEIRVGPDWTIIDLGCGVGVDSQAAALSLRPPGRVVGIDITIEFLRLARKYAGESSGPFCHWVAGDGEQLPLRSESVHLTIANGSFNLIPQKKQALAEVYRILKPGGHLALADLILVGEMEPITDGLEDAWAWCVAGALSSSEFDALLRSSGFSWWQVSTKYIYGPLASGHVLARKGGRNVST
jgi:SAM-dependent methyltransferase